MSVPENAVTVVVTRRIKPGCEEAFERSMKEFIEIAWTFPGHLGMQTLRPAVRDAEGEYTIIARFDSLASRRTFTSSPIYRDWMERLGTQSIGAPVIRELNDVNGWFALTGAPGSPPRWKMALTVWVGVYILSQVASALVGLVPGHWPWEVQALPASAMVVAALTWLVLPWTMRTFKNWYFPKNGR